MIMAVFQRSYLMPALFFILLLCLSFFLFSIDLDVQFIQGPNTVDYAGNLDLFSLEQDDPRLVEYVKHHFLIKTGTKGGKNLRLINNPPKLAGQFNQPLEVDKIYNSALFNGFFIEAGALNGEDLSNSLFFELDRNWTGLLVEANSELVETIQGKNRNVWISPTCLSIEMKPIFAEFKRYGIAGEIIKEQERGKGGSNVEQKTCIPLYTLLLALGNPSVHYFSLDIEGAELKVLKAIPWHLVDIWMVGIETNHIGEFDNTEKRVDVLNFMVSQGYKHIGTIGIDDMFIKPDKVSVSDELITYLNSLKIKSEYPNDPQI